MTNSVLQNSCYLIFFTLCIGQGDGRWKEWNRNNLRHDIDLYKKISEKIEQEIYAFYDEYPEEKLKGDNVDVKQYKYVTDTVNNIETMTANKRRFKLINTSRIKIYSTNNVSSRNYSKESTMKASRSKINSKWPKFEEIILAMGKKYDWKNDRWIKVKEKIKINKSNNRKKTELNNMIDYHENHKFRYQFVKLNKSKNRRSIVVAVSAIR